ncbi:MAG TPA: dioxygenase, partial [Novosphingobium sp.]|nr:dioxygenase [Novosphingobium sp.]
MTTPIFPELTEAVIAAMADAPDPRLRQIMTSLIRHVHAVVRETRLTEAEWGQAIAFLTAAGQISNDRRQEF